VGYEAYEIAQNEQGDHLNVLGVLTVVQEGVRAAVGSTEKYLKSI
jgi:hypothetical protein